MSMTIERGEKIAIFGCIGVGKSTLLKTMLGKIDPYMVKLNEVTSSSLLILNRK